MDEQLSCFTHTKQIKQIKQKTQGDNSYNQTESIKHWNDEVGLLATKKDLRTIFKDGKIFRA